MMPNEMMAPEGAEPPEQESTVTCPNCGAPLKLEMPDAGPPMAAQPAAPSAGPPSLRDTLTQAMGGGQ